MSKPSRPIWRKVLWWLGIAVSFNLALYILIPKIASFIVERKFETFGLRNVHVEFEYPGLQRTSIPLIAFQKDMGSETATLTIRNLTLEYHLPQLFGGFLNAVRIEELHLDITGVPSEQPQSIRSTSAVNSVGAPLPLLSQSLPDLPFGLFSLTKATIFREQATGPLRQVTISSLLRNEQGTLDWTITFQGIQGDAYTMQAKISPLGEMKIVLDSGTHIADPLLDVESVMKVSQDSGLHWQGTLTANLKRATPFLALLMPLGPDLERVDGMVKFQWDGFSRQMESLKKMLHDPSTQLHIVVDAHVELPAWGTVSEDISINVSGEVNVNSTEMRVDLSPPSFMKALLNPHEFPFHENLPFPHLNQRELVHIQLNDVVRSRISFDQKDPQWSIEGPIRVQYGEKRSPIGMDVTFTNASGRLLDPLSTHANAKFAVWGSLPLLEHQLLQVKDLRWILKGQMGLENQAIQVTLAEGSSVKTGLIQMDQGRADQVAFYMNQPVSLAYDWPLRKWNVGTTSAQIVLPKIHWRDQSVSISKIGLHLEEARGEGQDWHTKGTVKLLGVNTTMENFSPPTTNLAIGFEANSEEIQAGIVAETTDKTIRAKVRIQHHLQTNHGTLRATLTPQTFSPSTMILSTLIQPWTHPFDITSGQLGISIACVWMPTTPSESSSIAITRGDVTVTLKNIGGYYENVLFDDVNSTITIVANDLNNFATLPPATVSVGSVKAGVELTNTTFKVNLALGEGDALPTVDLENVSANVFGGQISSPRIYLDLARPPALFTVKLDGIQLDQLLQLEEHKGLDGTGILDGTIPITLNATTIQVKDGKLTARAPGGVIRFQSLEDTAHTLIQANPQMKIVLQSLRNFHYDVLRVGINYQEDGTLILATRLEGRNPDLKQGRPIHFNLNVEENIPALLKSLAVTKGIEDKIEQLFQGPLF